MESTNERAERNPPGGLNALSDPDPPGQYLIIKPGDSALGLGVGILIGLAVGALLSRCGCERWPRG